MCTVPVDQVRLRNCFELFYCSLCDALRTDVGSDETLTP